MSPRRSRGERSDPRVPAGVKIYSSVFAVTPGTSAGLSPSSIASNPGRSTTSTRPPIGKVRLNPVSKPSQMSRSRRPFSRANSSPVAASTPWPRVARDIDPDRTYVFGPGGTVGAIEAELEIDGVTSRRRRLATENPVTIVVSPIGGRSRGNHQISCSRIERRHRRRDRRLRFVRPRN